MDRPALSLRIGGNTYKVHASAPEEELARLVDLVEEKLREINPKTRPVTPQMFLLVALSLAHEVEEERTRRKRVEADTRDLLRRMLSRIDLALEEDDGEPDDGGRASAPTS